MLRIALLRPVARLPRYQARQFVSTVLLGKTYETETVQSLRQLAKQCGISSGGNKATLISRIQDHDKKQSTAALATHESGAAAAREASTASAQAPTFVEANIPSLARAPVPDSITPGINLQAQPTAVLPAVFTNILMPDISRAEPDTPTPIPFTPDHRGTPSAEPTLTQPPKILVVSGSTTHLGGGPSHPSSANIEHVFSTESTEIAPNFFTPASAPKVFVPTGFWREVAAEFGLPNSLQLIPEPDAHAQEEKIQSRPLDNDEKRGLWIVFGALVGCVAVGKVVTRKSEEH